MSQRGGCAWSSCHGNKVAIATVQCSSRHYIGVPSNVMEQRHEEPLADRRQEPPVSKEINRCKAMSLLNSDQFITCRRHCRGQVYNTPPILSGFTFTVCAQTALPAVQFSLSEYTRKTHSLFTTTLSPALSPPTSLPQPTSPLHVLIYTLHAADQVDYGWLEPLVVLQDLAKPVSVVHTTLIGGVLHPRNATLFAVLLQLHLK